MFKYVLVPVTGTPTDRPVFAAALRIARPFGARLAFLHVRADVERVIAAMASADVGGIGGAWLGDLIPGMEAQAAAQEVAARQEYEQFRGQLDGPTPAAAAVSTEFHVEVGEEAAWIAENGRSADLTMVTRRREDGGIAWDILEAALLGTGGYGHSRLREIVFGGFTRYMLETAELPVLMMHRRNGERAEEFRWR